MKIEDGCISLTLEQAKILETYTSLCNGPWRWVAKDSPKEYLTTLVEEFYDERNPEDTYTFGIYEEEIGFIEEFIKFYNENYGKNHY